MAGHLSAAPRYCTHRLSGFGMVPARSGAFLFAARHATGRPSASLISCAKRIVCAGVYRKGIQRSLRDVAAELERLGYLDQRGKQFSTASVRLMLTVEKSHYAR